MSREEGFPIADVDSSYFEDGKMRDLWQRLRDPDLMARAVCIHAATLLASWRQGERLTVAQACPLWLEPSEDVIPALKSSHLLDRSTRIPEASFVQWFGAAYARRAGRREIARAGGQASGHKRRTVSEPSVNRQHTVSEPVRPSIPSIPSVPTDAPSVPGEDGERDALDRYHELTLWRPWGHWSGDKLRVAIRDFGDPAVVAALEAEAESDPDRKTLLDRTLARLARSADREREKARTTPRKRRGISAPDTQEVLRELYAVKVMP